MGAEGFEAVEGGEGVGDGGLEGDYAHCGDGSAGQVERWTDQS